ncbi:MAG: DUF885 family protein, partial [Kangiella sp.]|nr:DUF885 family protein [Kangiella sp.]
MSSSRIHKVTILSFSIAMAISSTAVIASPSSISFSSSDKVVAAKQQTEAEKAAAIYAEHWARSLEMNPLMATFMGDNRFNDQLGDWGTEEGLAKQLAFSKEFLAKIKTIDSSKLQGQDLLSYKVFKGEREAEVEGHQYPDHLQPIQQFYNPFNFIAMLGSGNSAQPFNTV